MRRRCVLLSAVMLLGTAGVLSAQQRIEHRQPDFAMTIPAGLQWAEDARGNLLMFAPPAGKDGVVISAEDMGMIIGLEPLRASDLPAGSRLKVEYLPMRHIQVSVLVNRMSREGVAILIMGAQIPLRERGIQINVAGREDQEREVRDVLASVLSSFEGELVSPSAQQAQIAGVRRLSVRERLLILSWSVILVFGWCSLLAYLPLRLALIGRKDALLGLRANWLAVSAVCIVVGSSIRMLVTWDPVEWLRSIFYALIGVMVAFLALKARSRLVRRMQWQAKAPAAGNEPPAA